MKKLTTLILMVVVCGAVWGQTEDLSITNWYHTPNTANTNIGNWTKIAECNITYQWQDVGAIIDFLGNGSGDGKIYYGRIIARFKNQNNTAKKITHWNLILQNSNFNEDNIKAIVNDKKVELFVRIPHSHTRLHYRKILNGYSSALAPLANQTFQSELPSGEIIIDCQKGENDLSISSFKINKDGNVSKLLFSAQSNDPGEIRHIENNNAAELWIDPSDDYDAGATNDFFIVGEPDTNTKRFWVRGDGASFISKNLGIGKVASSDATLDVTGNIKAHEIEVTLASIDDMQLNGTLAANNITYTANGNTADFVFKDNYQLKDLSEVEAFIKANKHLPEIPSAEEMEETGVNLAEMNKLLLMKVEELTLYSIEQEKKIEKLTEDRRQETEENNEKVKGLEFKVEELTGDRRQETEEVKALKSEMEEQKKAFEIRLAKLEALLSE